MTMQHRSNLPFAVALEVKALYPVPILARACGVTQQRLVRLLRRNGVALLNSGRAIIVPLSEIRRRLPALWESLITAELLRAEARIVSNAA
jgi:hypothetical protein